MLDKLKLFFAALAVSLSLCACGHNAVVFGKGFGFRAGLDPEHMSADFSLIYGEQLTLAGRDNITIKLKTDVTGGSETATANTSADSILEISIGQQIQGYTVDAIEAGADAKDLICLNGNYPPYKEAEKDDHAALPDGAGENP